MQKPDCWWVVGCLVFVFVSFAPDLRCAPLIRCALASWEIPVSDLVRARLLARPFRSVARRGRGRLLFLHVPAEILLSEFGAAGVQALCHVRREAPAWEAFPEATCCKNCHAAPLVNHQRLWSVFWKARFFLPLKNSACRRGGRIRNLTVSNKLGP